MFLQGAFCVELALLLSFLNQKKTAISPLLFACLLLACFALGPASEMLGMLEVLAAQQVRGMLGMPGMLGMLVLGLRLAFLFDAFSAQRGLRALASSVGNDRPRRRSEEKKGRAVRYWLLAHVHQKRRLFFSRSFSPQFRLAPMRTRQDRDGGSALSVV